MKFHFITIIFILTKITDAMDTAKITKTFAKVNFVTTGTHNQINYTVYSYLLSHFVHITGFVFNVIAETIIIDIIVSKLVASIFAP